MERAAGTQEGQGSRGRDGADGGSVGSERAVRHGCVKPWRTPTQAGPSCQLPDRKSLGEPGQSHVTLSAAVLLPKVGVIVTGPLARTEEPRVGTPRSRAPRGRGRVVSTSGGCDQQRPARQPELPALEIEPGRQGCGGPHGSLCRPSAGSDWPEKGPVAVRPSGSKGPQGAVASGRQAAEIRSWPSSGPSCA